MRFPKGSSNSILLYKVIYSATSWNFTCMVNELEKYVKNIRNLIRGFQRSIYKDCLLLLFSCGNGDVRCSHFEIEFGKNSKAKHIHEY